MGKEELPRPQMSRVYHMFVREGRPQSFTPELEHTVIL